MTTVVSRRSALLTGVASSLAAASSTSLAIDVPGSESVLGLAKCFTSPITIASVEQVRVGKSIWLRVLSDDGSIGLCPGNSRLDVTVEMAKRLVIPFFIGKDARDIESLVGGV